MNRALAKYLLTLREDLSRYIWLSAISKSGRNGTVNLMYKDLLMEHHFKTKAELSQYFNPHQAAVNGVIKVLVDAESFISINFRLGSKQQAGSVQDNLLKKELITADNGEVTTADHFLNTKGYKPTQKFVYEMISDYITFFKNLQITKAAMVNVHLKEAAEPKINGEDVKHIKELCVYFSKLPGVKDEATIQACFRRVYSNWFDLTDYTQKGFDLRYISQNINQIIIQIQNLKNGSKDKREQQINTKIDRAGQKDYSRLARTRKKDD